MNHQIIQWGEIKMKLEKLLEGVRVSAIVCNQWGDTGKGKFVDFFSNWANIIARGTGGANAGHTINIGGEKYVFHLVPSGILYDSRGKYNVIGNGVAFDPLIMKGELDVLLTNGISFNNLKISRNAKLVLPHHIALDRLVNTATGETRIGSTGRGIGPVYEDHVGRRGLVVNDMLNPKVFREKLENNLRHNLILLREKDAKAVERVFESEALANGRFYDPRDVVNIDEVVKAYTELGLFFRNMIIDTDDFLVSALDSKKILLEGAQGFLLSHEHGTHPFVTSSDCSIQGLAKGVGLSEKHVDRVFGIIKGFYMTRVGEGPFPTEMGGDKSVDWCKTKDRKFEETTYPNPDINSDDEFERGIAVRKIGQEYGATTGRLRRVGWLDMPLLRLAAKTNGVELILTKLDVLDGCRKIKICNKHDYFGQDYFLGDSQLRFGSTFDTAVMDMAVLSHCVPKYVEFDGWRNDITQAKEYVALPHNLHKLIDYLETSGFKIRLLSVGPEREQTIVKG